MRINKILPCPALGVCIWLSMPMHEFWYFNVLLDTKIILTKMLLFKINFLCGISLTSASIWAKFELLTHWIDKVMMFWSMAPSTNPLTNPECTAFGTFMWPSTPPHAILRASTFHGQITELHSRHISQSIPFWKSVAGQVRRARECCQFWGFNHINPKFDSSKDKSWNEFEGWHYHISPIWSHED